MRRRQLILSVAGVTAAAVGTLALGAWRSNRGQPVSGVPSALTAMTWRLIDHHGTEVTPRDWIGRPAMVFFGFTSCPDVCPTTLIDISGWLEALGADADRLTVALITVDPERDTPDILADYLAYFDPRITGYAGSADDLALVATEFRARYEKIAQGDDYTMNHTAGVFLFHRDGRFANIIDFHEDRRFAVPKIRRILA